MTERLKQKLDEMVKRKRDKDILGKLALLQQPNKVGLTASQNSQDQQTDNNYSGSKKIGSVKDIGLRQTQYMNEVQLEKLKEAKQSANSLSGTNGDHLYIEQKAANIEKQKQDISVMSMLPKKNQFIHRKIIQQHREQLKREREDQAPGKEIKNNMLTMLGM